MANEPWEVFTAEATTAASNRIAADCMICAVLVSNTDLVASETSLQRRISVANCSHGDVIPRGIRMKSHITITKKLTMVNRFKFLSVARS